MPPLAVGEETACVKLQVGGCAGGVQLRVRGEPEYATPQLLLSVGVVHVCVPPLLQEPQALHDQLGVQTFATHELPLCDWPLGQVQLGP